jgi:inosose dehydratase
MTDRQPFRPGHAALEDRLAGAPISWGVCEVPDWGPQLPADEVLAEMRALGLRATEAGADGFLPEDGAELARALAPYGLGFVGGFAPVVLHRPDALAGTLDAVRLRAQRFARAGGSLLVSAVVTDASWSPRIPLSDDDWRRIFDGLGRIDDVCGKEGVRHVVHPHVGTLIETADDVERVLGGCDARLCLDTGHLRVGGVDAVALASEGLGRVGHVHLKDVRDAVAEQLRAGRADLREATRRGLFVPLGAGDARVADVICALEDGGYDGWYVLEQDTVAESGTETPTRDARRSIEFLRRLAMGQDLPTGVAGGEVSGSQA